jgi:hypothetical protein
VLIEDMLLQFVTAWRTAEPHVPDIGLKELSPVSTMPKKIINYMC